MNHYADCIRPSNPDLFHKEGKKCPDWLGDFLKTFVISSDIYGSTKFLICFFPYHTLFLSKRFLEFLLMEETHLLYLQSWTPSQTELKIWGLSGDISSTDLPCFSYKMHQWGQALSKMKGILITLIGFKYLEATDKNCAVSSKNK